MSREYNVIVGSGTVPTIAHGPVHNITPGSFPLPDQRNSLRNRTGEGVVVLNAEDYSVSIGIRSQAVSVGIAAVPLPTNPLEFRRALVVHNNGVSSIYLGDANVTVGTGLPLSAGEKIAFDIQATPNVFIYAISTGTVDVRIMELS